MKKKWLSTMIIVLMILTGLSLLLYPTISNYISKRQYEDAIANYKSTLKAMPPETYDEQLAAARAYNEELLYRYDSLVELDEERRALYESLLDITGTGVMGYIEIPSVNISLPIYHGTSDAVLQMGAGHLEGSSLPLGGESTHCVLSGHRGLPSARLFTDIVDLKLGEIFHLRVLNLTLTYEVDQILVVYPHQIESLFIEEGEDLCTLITCTPYSINTQRLLVRGHRIETPVEDPAATVETTPSPGASESGAGMRILLACILLVIICVLIFVIVRLTGRKRTRR